MPQLLSRLFLVLVTGSVGCGPATKVSVGQQSPNVVLIMADDLGWKDLNCYGNDSLDTPVLDQLADQGMLFTSAYSASPVCSPTRAAMMTGLAPARLNITNHAAGHPPGFTLPGTRLQTPLWNRHLSLDYQTIAERFQQAGYATAFVGKWHLSHRPNGSKSPTEEELRPEHQGFDVNIAGCDFGGPPSYFSPFKNPALDQGGQQEYLPFRLADECIEFIQSNKSKPFFLCWWNYSVHYPFQAPEELVKKYQDRKSSAHPEISNPTYAAMIEGMDQSIGRLIEYLNVSGLADQTLVIFTSDNGPFAADVRPLRGEKGHLYEGGIRVPFIARWPGKIQPGSRSDTPIISMDVVATLENVCHLPSNGPLDGSDLTPVLTGQGQLAREAIYFHYPNYAFHKKNRMGSAIRQGDFKLIKFYDGPNIELYNLKADIGEQNNLSESNPRVAQQLENKLDHWLKETGASQPVRLTD